MNLSWDYLGGIIAAIAGGIWSVYTFSKQRQEDRKWRQVQFLLELNQRFYENPEIRRCMRWIDSEHRHEELEKVFTDRRDGHPCRQSSLRSLKSLK